MTFSKKYLVRLLLHVATRNNDTEIIELLVDFGSSDVDTHDKEGFAPLHVA